MRVLAIMRLAFSNPRFEVSESGRIHYDASCKVARSGTLVGLRSVNPPYQWTVARWKVLRKPGVAWEARDEMLLDWNQALAD
jgi:hypothetical protein